MPAYRPEDGQVLALCVDAIENHVRKLEDGQVDDSCPARR